MAAITSTVIGAGLTAYGQKKSRDAQKKAMNKMGGVQMDLNTLHTPGGGTSGYTADPAALATWENENAAMQGDLDAWSTRYDEAMASGDVEAAEAAQRMQTHFQDRIDRNEANKPAEDQLRIDAGDVEATRGSLVDFANDASAGLHQGGMPDTVRTAMEAATDANLSPIVDDGAGDLFEQSQMAQEGARLTGMDARDQLQNGFQTDLRDASYDAAGNQLAIANQSPQEATDAALANFRAQALQGNQRAVDSTMSNLFSSGRLGSTGGANQMQALADSQNAQDLQFQQAALQEGRDVQNNAAGLMGQFSGQGGNIASTGDSLLNNAFARFGNNLQSAAGSNDQRFTRTLQGYDAYRQGAQQNLQNQMVGAGFGDQLRSGQLGNINAALTGQSGIQQQGLASLNANLAVSQAESNALIGAGSNVAAVMGSPNFDNSNSWSALGSGLANNATGIGDTISSWFTKAPTTPTTVPGQNHSPVPQSGVGLSDMFGWND